MHCSREARCLPGPPHIDRAFQLASVPATGTYEFQYHYRPGDRSALGY